MEIFTILLDTLRLEKGKISTARRAIVLVALIVLGACIEKTDPLGEIAQATVALVACQNSQEFPGECKSIEAALRESKLVALSEGHKNDAIDSAEELGRDSTTSKVHMAPMRKIRAAFESTWVPTEPEEFVFKLFSSHFHCSDLKALVEGKDLLIWVARGIEDGKLLFAFAPDPWLNLKMRLSESGAESLDTSPCIASTSLGIDESFAIVTRQQIAKLELSLPKVRGMETKYRIFPNTEEASAYFSTELARHCLHVVPSVEGADVKITRDGSPVKNQSLVKAGEYLVTVTQPGYLPFTTSQKVSKPMRVEAELEEAISIQPCEKGNVVVRKVRGVSVKDNCEWEYSPRDHITLDHEYSVTVKNNSNDRLFAIEYMEEKYDESGVKRSSKMLFSTLNGIRDAVSYGTTSLPTDKMKGIQALGQKGRAIDPGQQGRIDRQLFLNRSPYSQRETSVKIKVARFHFVQKEATVPIKNSGYGPLDFSFSRNKPECSVD